MSEDNKIVKANLKQREKRREQVQSLSENYVKTVLKGSRGREGEKQESLCLHLQ